MTTGQIIAFAYFVGIVSGSALGMGVVALLPWFQGDR